VGASKNMLTADVLTGRVVEVSVEEFNITTPF
jgi:hypothetical protein